MKKILEHFAAEWYKYVLEILVITIGILGAFALNNWNEHRLAKLEEEKIVANLHKEFKQSESLLRQKLLLSKQCYKAGLEVMKLMGASREELQRTNLDSLLFGMLPGSGDFLPAENAIENILQSGKLSLISNDSLIVRLYDWEAALLSVNKSEEGYDGWVTDKLVPLLIQYISLKQMDVYGGFEWTGRSKLETRYFDLFQSLLFENMVDNYLFLLRNNIEKLEKIQLLLEEIMSLTEPQQTSTLA